ncbi:TolC family protein, partial [Longibacter sp.]|uniref:TolC family protein n=1 Tax=Longibacter sp. TaxID=2045415 RepID=UPI003EBEE63A
MSRFTPPFFATVAAAVVLAVVVLLVPDDAAAQETPSAPDSADVLWVRQNPLDDARVAPDASDADARNAMAAHLARKLVRSGSGPDEPAPDTSGTTETSRSNAPRVLSLRDAVQIALRENYDLRRAELDVRTATAQVKEARGSVYPRVDVSGSYTRNIVQANPFAGSDVSSFLGGGGQGDWVAFNERARQDGDPSTEPITFNEFLRRQEEA